MCNAQMQQAKSVRLVNNKSINVQFRYRDELAVAQRDDQRRCSCNRDGPPYMQAVSARIEAIVYPYLFSITLCFPAYFHLQPKLVNTVLRR